VRHRLVLGIDGAGKSTLLDSLNKKDGTLTMEPTSSDTAREFKARMSSLDITSDLIAERKAIYLDLNKTFDERVRETLQAGSAVATTGNALVTMVSHSLMNEIVSGSEGEVAESVSDWVQSSESLKPDQLVLVHAPDQVIRQRIEARQLEGQADEKFWGFNSPYFLSRYQETWHAIIGELLAASDISRVSLSSVDLSPSEMLQQLQ